MCTYSINLQYLIIQWIGRFAYYETLTQYDLYVFNAKDDLIIGFNNDPTRQVGSLTQLVHYLTT